MKEQPHDAALQDRIEAPTSAYITKRGWTSIMVDEFELLCGVSDPTITFR